MDRFILFVLLYTRYDHYHPLQLIACSSFPSYQTELTRQAEADYESLTVMSTESMSWMRGAGGGSCGA
jgi:hypothetical protein